MQYLNERLVNILYSAVAKKLREKTHKARAEKIKNTYQIIKKADKTGEVQALEKEYPEIFYGLLRNNPEILFQGLEDLDESKLPSNETIYFLTTPDAVWVVNKNGVIIGEERHGFADLKYTKHNKIFLDLIKNAKSLI